nr:type II toxin-antitoxin system VapC family toxin [Longimicrobium terrae]
MYFLDSSAIVRLYVVEPGWSTVRELVRGAAADPPRARICACDLALPETISALQQISTGPNAGRRGLSPAAYRRTLPLVRAQMLETEAAVSITASSCIPLAADVVDRRKVRGADAVHIAAALTARETMGTGLPFVFVSGDARQCRAAEEEGLPVCRSEQESRSRRGCSGPGPQTVSARWLLAVSGVQIAWFVVVGIAGGKDAFLTAQEWNAKPGRFECPRRRWVQRLIR